MDLLTTALGYFVAWPLISAAGRFEFLNRAEPPAPGSQPSSSSVANTAQEVKERLKRQYASAMDSVSNCFRPVRFAKGWAASRCNSSLKSGNVDASYYAQLAKQYPISMDAFLQMAPDHRPLARFTKFSRVIHNEGGTAALSPEVIGWFNTRLGNINDIGTYSLNMGRTGTYNQAYLPPEMDQLDNPEVGLRELRQAYLGFVDDFTTGSIIAPFAECHSTRCTDYCLRAK